MNRNPRNVPPAPPQRPAVLVLGASSLVGDYLLPRLAQAGYEVHAVSRHPRRTAPEIHWHAADTDAMADAALRESLPRCVRVISLLPLWKLPAAAAVLHERGMRRLLAFSSTSALTKTDSADPAERELAERLIAAENALWTLARGDGAAVRRTAPPEADTVDTADTVSTATATTTTAAVADGAVALSIFRPTLIYDGVRDRNVTRIAGVLARYGFFPLPGAGSGLRQPVHAEDLAIAAVLALDAPASYGRCYELGGGETLAYRAMVERIGAALARRVRIFSLPPPLFALARAVLFLFRPPSPLARFFPRLARILAGISPEALHRMNKDMAFDWSAAARDFGYAPRAFRPWFPWRDKHRLRDMT